MKMWLIALILWLYYGYFKNTKIFTENIYYFILFNLFNLCSGHFKNLKVFSVESSFILNYDSLYEQRNYFYKYLTWFKNYVYIF